MSDAPAAPIRDADARSIVGGHSTLNRGRYFRDSVARWVVWAGGLGVIGALLLIFVYLLSEVMPLFGGAHVSPRQSFVLPGPSEPTLHIGSEEQGQVGWRLTQSGQVVFFDLHSGALREAVPLPMDEQNVAQFVEASRPRQEFVVQREDGAVVLAKVSYKITFDSTQTRVITPVVEYPFGDTPMAFADRPARFLAARADSSRMFVAGAEEDGSIVLKRNEVQTSLFGDSSMQEGELQRFSAEFPVDRVFIDSRMFWLYAVNDREGRIALYNIRGADPVLVNTVQTDSPIKDSLMLSGALSLVVAQEDGRVSQWFPARDAEGVTKMAKIRTLSAFSGDAITAMGSELYRRSFAVGNRDGEVAFLHATAQRRVWSGKLMDEPIALLSFNPRAQYLMVVGESGEARGFNVENEHPEFSMSAIWTKVWYEGYEAPGYFWQSSAAVNDFEPKFSLTPLAFGTLKAAFYAMLFAIPLAILGAIFTANFMSSEMRQAVKPTIELMEALPTVILGFLAGLWLAPFVETNLPGVFLLLLLLPFSIPLFGYLWIKLPRQIRQRVPPGWEAALLIPVVAFVVWFCFAVAKPLEVVLFTGTMQQWMDQSLGIPYDQRNALVVGIAMGIAVIPTIYSITEDAVFSVPKQLSLGSLALGATPWQTLMGVVLPTASPGIFSAVMIGVGRAVGETMIVLMATGNTAVLDPSIFQGLRTLSANIAVELPESEVGGTHFRLLFLSGLVLFLFTFMFNTWAEVVRQRLRQKYASI